jgi:hypothetical protein
MNRFYPFLKKQKLCNVHTDTFCVPSTGADRHFMAVAVAGGSGMRGNQRHTQGEKSAKMNRKPARNDAFWAELRAFFKNFHDFFGIFFMNFMIFFLTFFDF